MDNQNRRADDKRAPGQLQWDGHGVEPKSAFAQAARESTRLANAFAEAAQRFLDHMGTGAAMAVIPETQPLVYVVAGTLPMIAQVLPKDEGAPADMWDAFKKWHDENGDQDCECTWQEAWKAALATQPSAPSSASIEGLTEDQITAVWNSMPGQPGGFLKSFGYWQFAKVIEREVLATQSAKQGAQPSAWISVDERLPAKECLAVYVTPNGKQRMVRAKYIGQFQVEATGDEIDQCETECREDSDDDTLYLKAGWLECIDNWGDYSSVAVCEGTVTHWQPLPALPGAAPDAQVQADVREAVRDAVVQALSGVYYCERVWSAWSAGTMGEDDFTPAAEVDEVLDEITDAAIDAMKSKRAASTNGEVHQ